MMNRLKNINNSTGFTLVEVLVVMVIMGLVMTSVYSLFISSKRTTNTSEEVVDVQQNLRVATETLVSDVRMAGFLIPSGETAITTAPDVFGIDENRDNDLLDAGDSGAFFTMQTSSSMKTYARIVDESFSSPTVTLELEAGMIGQFETGYKIRVIRPATLVDLSGDWTIVGVNEGNNEITVTDAGYVAGTIELGDMIVRKLVGEASPTVINYWLRPTENAGTNNFELMRGDGNSNSVVASNIGLDLASNLVTLDLTYLMSDGNELDTTTDFDQIRAVRVNISAETDNTKTGLANYSGVKRRTLQTLVKIRNALGE